jgi:hypothetical protein
LEDDVEALADLVHVHEAEATSVGWLVVGLAADAATVSQAADRTSIRV